MQRQEQDDGAAQAAPACPACGEQHVLVVLGTRRDRTNSWLIWHTTRTVIYMCLHCEAVVSIQETHARRGTHSPQQPVAVIAAPLQAGTR
jgi:phage terminase large subunit GpA-like protein